MQEARPTPAVGLAHGGTPAVRILVIEPAAGRRRLIRTALVCDSRIIVAGMAADLAEARALLPCARADVLVADASMQGLAALAAVARITLAHPLPVVLLSSGLGSGPARTSASAPTPAEPRTATLATLADTLIAVSGAAAVTPATAPGRPADRQTVPRLEPSGFRWNGRLILIGASTGGVDALARVLAGFPVNCPPTVILQHMPEGFLASFAARLDQAVAPSVRLARDGDPLRPGEVLIAPGGRHHLMFEASRSGTGGGPRCRLIAADKRNGHRPSADHAFDSACAFAPQVVAALLTGMGRDGAAGLRGLREAGARTLAQDEATSVVWGMPRIAWENGGAEELVALDRIAARLIAHCSRGPLAAPPPLPWRALPSLPQHP